MAEGKSPSALGGVNTQLLAEEQPVASVPATVQDCHDAVVPGPGRNLYGRASFASPGVVDAVLMADYVLIGSR